MNRVLKIQREYVIWNQGDSRFDYQDLPYPINRKIICNWPDEKRILELEPDEPLWEEGEFADNFCVILEGDLFVKIRKKNSVQGQDESEKYIVLYSIPKNGILGDAPILHIIGHDPNPSRTATVYAGKNGAKVKLYTAYELKKQIDSGEVDLAYELILGLFSQAIVNYCRLLIPYCDPLTGVSSNLDVSSFVLSQTKEVCILMRKLTQVCESKLLDFNIFKQIFVDSRNLRERSREKYISDKAVFKGEEHLNAAYQHFVKSFKAATGRDYVSKLELLENLLQKKTEKVIREGARILKFELKDKNAKKKKKR